MGSFIFLVHIFFWISFSCFLCFICFFELIQFVWHKKWSGLVPIHFVTMMDHHWGGSWGGGWAYIYIYIHTHFFCGFSGLSSWKRGKLPCSTWCMMLGSLEITNSTYSYALHMSHHESQVFRHHLSDTTMLISTLMGPKEIVNIAQWHGRDARGQPSPRKQCNASKRLCVRGCQAGWGLDVFCTVRFWCNAKLGSFHPSQMLKTFL